MQLIMNTMVVVELKYAPAGVTHMNCSLLTWDVDRR